jgi:hypothetical protein
MRPFFVSKTGVLLARSINGLDEPMRRTMRHMKKQVLVVALFVWFFSGTAQAQTFADWSVDMKQPDAIGAATTNESGHDLGMVCFIDRPSCYWMITSSILCEEDRKYPMLANSDDGAVYVEVRCIGKMESGNYGYVFTDFDKIDTFVQSGDRIGFAIPMEADSFRVVRFSLRGAEDALALLQKELSKRLKSAPKNTRDQRI